MKYNPEEVAQLQPDYLGFIFWEPSSRYFDGIIPKIPSDIEKIGVFVDEDLSFVLEQIEKHGLQGVQLHGKESKEYCMELQKNFQSFQTESKKRKAMIIDEKEVSTSLDQTSISSKPKIIKVFSIIEGFDFSIVKDYEGVCDYFLFDTKGKLPGGNGFSFDWSLLKDYPSSKPYFLSGGVGLENVAEIKEFLKRPESNHCHAIDVNSKFEEKPGLKNIEQLEEFKSLLSI